MKRLIVLLALAFTLALVPAVIALKAPKGPRIECTVHIEFDWVQYKWIGDLDGDIDTDPDDFTVTPGYALFPGATEHFFEMFEILTEDSDGDEVIIRGFNEGVWNFKTGKWRTNGRVYLVIEEVEEGETPEFKYLIGKKVHIMGYTTELIIGEPIYGDGIMRIG